MMEEEVVRSGLDYVIARPPILKDDPSMGGATLMISRSRGHVVNT
jgi:hypothetical protein